MDASVGLLAASGLVNFLLRSTAEWLVCLLLVRIAVSARTRFRIWLAMLAAFAAQWMWMMAGIVRAALHAAPATGAVAAPAHPVETGARIAVAAPAAGLLGQIMAGLATCYVAIVLWRICGALAARLRLTRAMRHRGAPNDRVLALFREVIRWQPALQRAELWILPGLGSPATVGWLRPRVILPSVCQSQDEPELKAVFWHELKHVERRDALWNALVRASRHLLWFHPAVHAAVAALASERELACDAAVVHDHPQSRDVYASCLLRFARVADLAPEPAVPTIEMASSTSLLTVRVHSILSDDPQSSRTVRALRAATNVTLIGAMAATVPGLNVLFAAAESTPMLRLPDANLVQPSATPAHRRSFGPVRLTPASLQTSAVPASTAFNSSAALSLPHDEALAAEHKAALGVLTESTGMDEQGSGRGLSSESGLNGTPGRGNSGPASATVTSVAVDAAEKMAPLMIGGDHDGDGKH